MEQRKEKLDCSLTESIVEKVFPSGAKLLREGSTAPSISKYWAIGSRKGLRWIVPHSPRYGLSVLQQWRPYGAASYLKWQLLLVAYQWGLLNRVPGATEIAIADVADRDWQHLGFDNSQIQPVIYVGTPGPNQKAVVSIVDSGSYRIKGIAKVPIASNARKKILQEADNLNCLADQKPGLAPQVLCVKSETGIAVQTAISGKPTGTALASVHMDWFEQTHIPDQHTSLHQHVTELHQRLRAFSSHNIDVQTRLTRILEILDDETPLPAVWVHGDFTPWNLKWSGDRKLIAVDWEEAYPNGLPLQDLFHFQYIQAHLIKPQNNILDTTRLEPAVVKYLNRWGINPKQYEKLALFYLVDTWVRSRERTDYAFADFILSEIRQVEIGSVRGEIQ